MIMHTQSGGYIWAYMLETIPCSDDQLLVIVIPVEMCSVSATQQCDPTLFSLIPHATIGTHLSEHSGFNIRLGCVGWSVGSLVL
jgi:hypothetical protein